MGGRIKLTDSQLVQLRKLLFAHTFCFLLQFPLQQAQEQIDALIEAGANNTPLAATADDAEFLRRIFLDFTGSIPTLDEARAFLADKSPDKRSKLIDQLITNDHYPRRMAELFHVMLMERRGDHAEWQAYLLESFKANKPWDQLAREILGPDPWAYGLEANRHVLETLVQYTYEQGLISKKLDVDSLFAKSTLEEFKI